MRLGPVLGRVVKFPNVVTERWLRPDDNPGEIPVTCYCGPTLVIDATIADHLEVLRLVTIRCPRIVKRVQHADAVQWFLHHAIHKCRCRESGSFEHSWSHVDHVVEL